MNESDKGSDLWSGSRKFYRNGQSAPPDTISFRLQKEELRALAERAAVHNLSIHQYARLLVIEALFQNDAFMEAVGGAIQNLHGEAHKLREDLAFSMKTLLMTAGKVPEKEAIQWVKQNFKPSDGNDF